MLPSHQHRLPSPNDLEIFYRGPPIKEGKYPALFYFALSGYDSLFLDPFNQPIEFLKNTPIRLFSFTLPLHGPKFNNIEGMSRWAEAILEGNDLIETFLTQAEENIHFLIQNGSIDPNKIAISGLSRGGLIAMHLACRLPKVQTLLLFAPLLHLEDLNEFQGLKDHPFVSPYKIEKVLPLMVDKQVRLYIGNRDVRVQTKKSIHFIEQLVELMYKNGVRSPPAELILSPSIGHKGHGTSPEVFNAGSEWIKTILLGKP